MNVREEIDALIRAVDVAQYVINRTKGSSTEGAHEAFKAETNNRLAYALRRLTESITLLVTRVNGVQHKEQE